MMLAILPCVPLLLWIAGVRRKGVGWRKAFLYGSIASCLFLVYSTEVLSFSARNHAWRNRRSVANLHGIGCNLAGN